MAAGMLKKSFVLLITLVFFISLSINSEAQWVTPEEQIENTSLDDEPANKTWFLFTNHIGCG